MKKSNVRNQKSDRVAVSLKIKKGDSVEVITGKDRGKRGPVERVLPMRGQVYVGGLNMVKRHQKRASTEGATGGIVEKPAPLDVSNVMLVCPNCDLKTRVAVNVIGDKRMRVCKKCHKEIG